MTTRTPTGYMIPAIQYHDAAAAIEWLCDKLGFHKKLVVPCPEGDILHSQLILGKGMVMISTHKESEYGKHFKAPKDIDGANTQSLILYIQDEDIKKHYEQAKDRGAEIVFELRDEPYGGQYYAVRDEEGHLWNITSYDPYADPSHS